MSLKCSFVGCSRFELSQADQLAFYQDLNTGGWNLALGPEFVAGKSSLPNNIGLLDTGDPRFPYNVICANCQKKIGKVNTICGFENPTVNFSAKKVFLRSSVYGTISKQSSWGKSISIFPEIRKITAIIPQEKSPEGPDTVHFHGASDLQDMIQAGRAVALKSGLIPKRYQWRAYFFACLQNCLLCLPTGMGKTLIANLLMKAYLQRNPEKGQVFIVPTVVLVDQQATVIETNCGLKVERRSSEHTKLKTWSQRDIVVCTHAMLVNAIKMKQVDMSQFSLLVLDEVHEANSPSSMYGLLLPYILKCPLPKRPRVLALTASPSGVNTTNMRESISTLSRKLEALPYTPLLDDDKNTDKANEVTCNYVSIHKTSFEVKYEDLVMDTLNRLSLMHNYFNGKWNIQPNISVKLKINTVKKILSHANLVSQNNGDLKLRQLSNWMNKWIDSFDVLEICGPMKLIQYIKSDIEFAEKNDALSTLSSQISTLFDFLRLSINQIEREYEIPVYSPRVNELLKYMKPYRSKTDRILIFVERRSTAERLSNLLKEEPDTSSLNPDYVVGMSSSGHSKEMQQAILQDFHQGKCQVLVATSVLEQGIDVTACGVVICFDGINSMKSMIQTRGRARKKAAHFVAFVDADKQRRANELTTMEIAMNYAIRQLMQECNSKFSPQFTELVEQFLDSDHETFEGISDENGIENEIEEEFDSDVELPDGKTLLHLRLFNFRDSENLCDHISSIFQTPIFDRFVSVRKNFITVQFAVTESDAYDSLRVIQEISTAPDRISARGLTAWIETISEIDTGERIVYDFSVTFNSLVGFHFNNSLDVQYDEVPVWREDYILKIRKNKIVLRQGSNEFWIHPIDVDGYILITDTSDSFEIFLCLRNPPTFFIQREIARFDFTNKSFNLCLKRNSSIDRENSWKIRDGLQYFALAVYNVCNLREQRSVENYDSQFAVNRTSEGFKRDYLIRAWHSKHAAVLPPILPRKVLSKFENCLSIETLELLLNNTVPLRFYPLHLQNIMEVELPFPEFDPPKNYSLFGRVKVTPYRLIFLPMIPLQKNRVFRYFPNPQNFLLISFSDEHDGNPWRSTHVYEWFLSVLSNGFSVGGKHFNFLGCSNSQLKEGHCWFSCLDRQKVYDIIGTFPETIGPGRKLTRLALAFASSIPTVPLDHRRYLNAVEPDVIQDNVNFSDGIGRASFSLFEKMKAILKLPQKVSAFQIRVGGIKGVISLYDEMEGEEVMFRESMKKFDSSHNMLEVLNHSFSIPLFLNRHVILLLSSFGVPNEVFLNLQHNDLMKCLQALIQDEKALSFVKSHSRIFDWQMFPDDQVVHEPFFRQILISNTIQLVSGIINQAHISVSKGRVLMGVLDETNTLEYGEVYAHIVEEDFDMELEGEVVVFRNPCVLPSDVRVLSAVIPNKKRMRNLYQNCLVLPSRGPDSHARECSGGDLDGDLYYVIWDKTIIPPNLERPGVKVIEVETQAIDTNLLNLGTGYSHHEMMQFFCDYVSKNQLGIIANAHLATSDKLGIYDPKSVQLARYVTAETDAPKKGLTVGKIDPELMPTEYPDYMRKSDRKSYRSETVLGELFRQSQPILEVLLEKRIIVRSHQQFDISKDNTTVNGLYTIYCFEIKKLMQSFELETEVDLFSGTPQWRKGYMSQYKQQHQLSVTVSENVTEFWRKWQENFEKWRSKVSNDQEKILEWYYQPNSQKSPMYSFSFLAMPFVDFDEKDKKTIAENIQIATLRWVNYNKLKWLADWRQRFQVGQSIMQKLAEHECHFYGSSMLGLNEDYSDLDIYVSDRDFPSLSKKLKDIDQNVVSMKKPHACVRLTYDSLPVDVTNFIGGVEKTYTIAEAFDKNKSLWPALRVLLEWARTVRVVKSGGSQGLMNVVSFCHLLIHFVSPKKVFENPTPKKVCDQQEFTLSRFGLWIESLRNSQCGELIYEFLSFISNRKNKKWIVERTDPWNGEPLIRTGLVDELIKNAEIALYILAVHDGDVYKLFQYCTKCRLFRIDKVFMKPETVSEEKKEQCLREIKAKCNPKKHQDIKFELVDRNGVFYLEVTGNHKYFSDVERGLNKIHNRLVSSRISGLKNLKVYHIKGSTLIIPELGQGLSTKVSFSTYQGENFMPQHTGTWKSVLTFNSSMPNPSWEALEYKRYENLFLKQMQFYKEKNKSAAKRSRTWRFFGNIMCNIRCGNHYLFNVPENLINTFEAVTLSKVEECVSKAEEALGAEKREDILQDLRNYNSSTLLHSQQPIFSETPLQLMPLQEMKFLSARKNKDLDVTSTSKKKSSMISHSFYPQWTHGVEKAKEFASQLGLTQVDPLEEDHYTSISVYWRQRELVIWCDSQGMINNLRHRSTRWLSATFKRNEQNGGDDVRTYLECRAPLDDDESSLETVVDYLNKRSVFSFSYAKQIDKNNVEAHNKETFTTRPLIPEMFHLNLRFRSMRRITSVAKFVNANNDTLLLHEVFDGIFRIDTREFEWFPKHYELEIRMGMENRTDQELCKKSYDFSLKLFDFTKENLNKT